MAKTARHLRCPRSVPVPISAPAATTRSGRTGAGSRSGGPSAASRDGPSIGARREGPDAHEAGSTPELHTAGADMAERARHENWRWPALAVAFCMTALVLLLGAHTDSASAKSEIFRFESNPSTTQAGGHPDVFTTFELGGRDNQEKVPCECNDPKDVIQHIPAGVSA